MNRALLFNIQQIRNIKNLDQAYLADQLGVSTEWYSKMETGKTNLKVDQLEKIVKILGIEVKDLYEFDSSHIFEKTKQIGLDDANFQNSSLDKEIIEKLLLVLERLSRGLGSVKVIRKDYRKIMTKRGKRP